MGSCMSPTVTHTNKEFKTLWMCIHVARLTNIQSRILRRAVVVHECDSDGKYAGSRKTIQNLSKYQKVDVIL